MAELTEENFDDGDAGGVTVHTANGPLGSASLLINMGNVETTTTCAQCDTPYKIPAGVVHAVEHTMDMPPYADNLDVELESSLGRWRVKMSDDGELRIFHHCRRGVPVTSSV